MIVFLNRDLFFGVRVANALRSRGDGVEIVPDAARFVSRLGGDAGTVRLGLIDMGAVDDWAALATLATGAASDVPLLAFGPHKDIDAFRTAKGAGIDRVVSNGTFHREFLTLIDRYAAPARPDDQLGTTATTATAR